MARWSWLLAFDRGSPGLAVVSRLPHLSILIGRTKIKGDELVDRILALHSGIRYCAVYRDGQLFKRSKPNLGNSESSDESDKYEELFVNPTLLTLAHQRGELDCGGTRWLLVRYGNFFQWMARIAAGHLSVAIEAKPNVVDVVARLEEMMAAGV